MLTLSYHGHTLIGVPAIHNRAVFAEFVNRSCACEEFRPTAIAVELDPAAVNAVASWLTELGVISGRRSLPCMLGFSRLNKLIHPRYREAAVLLQEKTGRQLHAISPDILRRELGYAAVSLLCLSPTDSMIEAVRCALEMEIPLYGIDMDDSPHLVERISPMLRDPVAAREDFAAYVTTHVQQLDQIRDQHSDLRREIVMAARLKTLLHRHDRVLFTCGMAHWQSICRLLTDESLKPANDVPLHGPVSYERILVHPHKALQQMDLFPKITAAYEAMRLPATNSTGIRKEVNFQELFQSRLERGCSRYFELLEGLEGTPSSPESNHGFGSFSSYLANLCLLSQRMTPDLPTAVSAALSMMSGDFVEALTESLMEFEWASPADFPDLPVIAPCSSYHDQDGDASNRAVMKIPRDYLSGNSKDYESSATFYVAPQHGENSEPINDFRWEWKDEPQITSGYDRRYNFNYIWPPCENLFYASIYEAVNVADVHRCERRSDPFTNSLHDGIDLKASLRSCISGKNRLYVKRTVKKVTRPVRGEPVTAVYTDKLELQPTVFIFSRETVMDSLSWECLRPGDAALYDDLSARGKRMYNRAISNGDNSFIESINLTESQPVPDHMRPWVKSLRVLHGSVRFGNPCVNFFQSAVWLEKGRFKSSPILPGFGSIGEIVAMYRERHLMDIDLDNWGNALILFALPYAVKTRRVVVVAPTDFRISLEVRHEARRRRIELFSLPLSHFPAERISHIRQQYSVQAGKGGKEYPPELERVLGQSQYTYQNLLPQEIRRQAKPKNTC